MFVSVLPQVLLHQKDKKEVECSQSYQLPILSENTFIAFYRLNKINCLAAARLIITSQNNAMFRLNILFKPIK